MGLESFLLGFTTIFVGHTVSNAILQRLFFPERRGLPPWLSLLFSSKKAGSNSSRSHNSMRHPLHDLYASINLWVASCVCGQVANLISEGKTKVSFEPSSMAQMLRDFFVIVAWQSVTEYYWHRLMHLPVLYKRLHKFHHFYKQPRPFDDMFIHPLESAGYQLILFSPPFLWCMHMHVFLLYMALMGSCGILDHSGIPLRVGRLYDTADHAMHHKLFEVNYAFPFPAMDLMHHTSHSQALHEAAQSGAHVD